MNVNISINIGTRIPTQRLRILLQVLFKDIIVIVLVNLTNEILPVFCVSLQGSWKHSINNSARKGQ